MDYTTLVTTVQDYAENDFNYASNPSIINTFIKQAEQRIYNTVQIANLRKNVEGALTSGNKYLSAPSDFLSTYSLAIYPAAGGDFVYLLNKDVNFLREAYPDPSVVGKPRHYAIFGPQSSDINELSFIVGPTPDASYKAELHYYYYPPSIVTSGSTWLGDNFDSALLNGTMLEALTYMKVLPEDAPLYSQRYAESIALLKNLGDGKQRMDAYRDGQVRLQVN
jgi:hypothetical protein